MGAPCGTPYGEPLRGPRAATKSINSVVAEIGSHSVQIVLRIITDSLVCNASTTTTCPPCWRGGSNGETR